MPDIPFDKRKAAAALKRVLIQQVGLSVSPTQDRQLQGWLESALISAYQKGVLDGTGQ